MIIRTFCTRLPDSDTEMACSDIAGHIDNYGTICLEQKGHMIVINRASVPELCKLLKTLADIGGEVICGGHKSNLDRRFLINRYLTSGRRINLVRPSEECPCLSLSIPWKNRGDIMCANLVDQNSGLAVEFLIHTDCDVVF